MCECYAVHRQLPLLLLVAAGTATDPGLAQGTSTRAPDIPGEEVCPEPSYEDLWPYTLCLAENWFKQAEEEMEMELQLTLTRVRNDQGRGAVLRLVDEQMKWSKRRNRECEKQWADSSVNQVSRNMLDCHFRWTENRTAYLKALVRETK